MQLIRRFVAVCKIQSLFAGFVMAVVWLCFSVPAVHAQFMELSEKDIVVTRLSESTSSEGWPICNGGGYYPVTLSIQNRGPDASLRVSSQPTPNNFYKSPVVEKRFDLAQNATIKITLLLPIVSYQQSSMLRVEKDGKQLEQLEWMVHVASNEPSSPSFLVIASARPDLNSLSQACRFEASRRSLGSSSGNPNLGLVSPASLPDTWLAYSSIETVVADAKTFTTGISDSQRVELCRWVRSGGRLILVGSSELSDGDQKKMERFLNENGIGKKRAGDLIQTEASTRYGPNDIESYAGGFGEVRVSRENLFGATDRKAWYPMFFDEGDSSDPTSWLTNHGFSTRFQSNNYLEFVDAGVQKIPTFTFIILITLFATVIGPVNYFVLRRKNKIPQLLWTTPLIALAASVFLIGWSTIANGTDNKVRLRSFSILDQNSQSIVSKTRASLFSGVSPRNGLRFEPFTEVLPIWPSNDSFQVGEVDWTDAQVIKGSFHQGNSRSQFLLTTPRTERGRMQIGTASNDKLSVTNGLEWSIQNILVCDENGHLYFGNDLWKGETGTLTIASPVDIQNFVDEVSRQSLRAPRGSSSPLQNNRRRSRGKSAVSTTMGTSQLERQFTVIGREMRAGRFSLPKNSYLAILTEAPGLDLGLDDYSVTEQLHVLLGHY